MEGAHLWGTTTGGCLAKYYITRLIEQANYRIGAEQNTANYTNAASFTKAAIQPAANILAANILTHVLWQNMYVLNRISLYGSALMEGQF